MIDQEKINKICLGTANFGSSYGINKKKAIKKKEIKKIFDYAIKNNINFLDTAINYKNSEKIIGLINKHKFKIVTKLPKIPKKITNIEKWVINQIIKSCKRLKVKNLYGLLIHYTSELVDKKKSKEIYRAFDYLLSKKLVKKIGLSIYEPRELDLYFKEYDYQIVQAPINIFDKRLITSGWKERLLKKEIEIFARSIFLKGLLLRDSNKIPKNFSRWDKKFLNFEKWTIKEKISKVEACIRFTDSFKGIKKIILGINNLEHLKQNISFLKKKKLIFPKNLNIASGKILNPRKWKI
jgi:aryl-alcohol dehydrogenase-like predicted oxidoreductase|tara:strand:+ start:2257 stop:3141 length:885 start_codon:yes stop_codon:yes gene_type:complete